MVEDSNQRLLVIKVGQLLTNINPPWEHFYLPDLHPGADQCSTMLSEQHSVWMRTIKWLLQCWDGSPFHEVISNSRTAHGYGFFEKRILGLTGYPKLRQGIPNAGERLWHFFHPSTGGHRSLRRAWTRGARVTVASAGG